MKPDMAGFAGVSPELRFPTGSKFPGRPGDEIFDFKLNRLYKCLAPDYWVYFAAIQLPGTIELTYNSIGDTNGVVYLLGTNFNVAVFTNPHTAGYMTVLRMDDAQGTAADLVDRVIQYTSSGNSANDWLFWDLGGATRSIILKSYTIQNAASNPTQLTRNWKIQGTNTISANTVAGVNAATWTDIDVRVNDASVVSPTYQAVFNITGTPAAYRYLRLLNTGANLAGLNYIQICEMEFYGTFAY